MKKRVLSILLAVIMVFSVMPMQVQAADFTGWTVLTSTGGMLSSGNYYLNGDVTLTSNITISGTVTLDLNGHVLKGNGNGRVITVNSGAELTVTDSNTGEQTHKFRVDGNGLWVLDETSGTETITGGVITGGNITGNGGGVLNNGTFTLKSGTIAGNTASRNGSNTGAGGGLYDATGATTKMEGGVIRGNIAQSNGGGLHISGTLTMTGGEISNNIGDWGGGLEVNGTCTAETVQILGGRITGNKSTGGGAGINADGALTIANVTITGNNATNKGGGVRIATDGSSIGGGTVIDNNLGSGSKTQNLYIDPGKKITLGAGDNAPQTGMSVGVTTQTTPEEGTPVQITTNGASTDTSYFTPDNDAYEVKFNTDHLELAVKATSHNHVFTYAANDGKLTATCTDGCTEGYNTNPLTLTLTAPANLSYDGTAKEFTFADGEADAWTEAGPELPTITYAAKSESSLTNSKAVNAGSYTASITVDTDKTATADFEITKATPYIKTNPSPSDINYGEKLSDSTLFDGYVQVSNTNSTQVAGLFVWTEPDTIPTIADSNTTLFSVTFTPIDEENYNSVSCQVKITVNHTHNPVKVDGQAATVTASGWKDYYECACGEYFEDENCTTSIDDLTAWKAEGGNGYIAKLDAPKYGITVSNDGNGTASSNVSEAASGTNVTLTAEPSSGYVFDAWEVISGSVSISNNSFTMPSSDVSIKATFKLLHTHDFTGNYIEYDTTNHKWAKKCSCGEYDEDHALIGVEIPKAKTGISYDGTKKMCFAKDYSDYCTIENDNAVDAGMYLAKCILKEGYIWADGTTKEKDIEWQIAPQQHIVKFDLNNGETNGPEKQFVESGKKASAPEAPTYEGFKFAGWYTDKDCTDGNEFDFESEVKKDYVLYAKWVDSSNFNEEPEPDIIKPVFTISDKDLKANSLSIADKFKVVESKNTLKVTWSKVSNADGYFVWAVKNGKSFESVKPQKVKGSKNTSLTLKTIGSKKYNKKKDYKIYVAAYKTVDGEDFTIAKSVTAYVAGSKSKYTNAKSITVKSKVSVKKGKSIALNAKVTKVDTTKNTFSSKQAAKLRYEASNDKIKVDANGKVKGVKKGTAYVYIYAQNGMCKKVKITVK